MLRFELFQLYLPSSGRFFLPLPKLTTVQTEFLAEHLEERGFEIRRLGRKKRTATKGTRRIAIDGSAGVAKSNVDLWDPLGPAIPRLLKLPRERPSSSTRSLYFELKRSEWSAEIQFFPRLESLGNWTGLREAGLCGLTPDAALVIRRLLEDAGDAEVDCVSAIPRHGSIPSQIGRSHFYRSKLPATEFLSSLRDMVFNPTGDAYLPRASVVKLDQVRPRFDADELGQWCYAAF